MNLSTNGTIYDDELLDKILTNFKGLGFNISIDGIENQFDYIRHGNNWDNVKSNLDKFHNLLTSFDFCQPHFETTSDHSTSKIEGWICKNIPKLKFIFQAI